MCALCLVAASTAFATPTTEDAPLVVETHRAVPVVVPSTPTFRYDQDWVFVGEAAPPHATPTEMFSKGFHAPMQRFLVDDEGRVWLGTMY